METKRRKEKWTVNQRRRGKEREVDSEPKKDAEEEREVESESVIRI